MYGYVHVKVYERDREIHVIVSVSGSVRAESVCLQGAHYSKGGHTPMTQ